MREVQKTPEFSRSRRRFTSGTPVLRHDGVQRAVKNRARIAKQLADAKVADAVWWDSEQELVHLRKKLAGVYGFRVSRRPGALTIDLKSVREELFAAFGVVLSAGILVVVMFWGAPVATLTATTGGVVATLLFAGACLVRPIQVRATVAAGDPAVREMTLWGSGATTLQVRNIVRKALLQVEGVQVQKLPSLWDKWVRRGA